jgi:hypothetical protein
LQDRARPEREQEATVLSSSVRPTDGGWVLNCNHALPLLCYCMAGGDIIIHHFGYIAPYELKRDFSDLGSHSRSADVSCPASIASCYLFSLIRWAWKPQEEVERGQTKLMSQQPQQCSLASVAH